MNWLGHDHKSFESAVYKCRTASDRDDWSLVREIFDELASGYKEHVGIEEDVLFPAYDALPGASTGPTDSLKQDHKQIFNLMDRIAKSLDQGAPKNLTEDFSLLYRVIIKHHEKEEKIFLPMASEVLYSNKDSILTDIKSKLKQAV